MLIIMIDGKRLLKEIIFNTSRASGKGGQHVNKVSTKVELIFNIEASALFSEEEKQLILSKSGKYLKDGISIHLFCSESRSQLHNKKIAFEKLIKLLEKYLKHAKERIPTEIPDEENEKRLAEKKHKAEKKQNRQRVE